MSDVVGRGVIEVSADASKLTAGINDAKRSIKSLGKDVSDSMGTASASASRSIDRYITKLQTVSAVQGKSARETELYTLSLRGASKAQLDAADSALKMSENYEKGVAIGEKVRIGFIALAAAAATAAIGIVAGTKDLIEQVANYKGLSEKIGDTAVNVASLKTASDVSGVSLETIAAASIKLTSALSKTDDESKAAGAAITALGLNFQQFKQLSPVEQIDAVSKAMAGFADGSEKTAVAVALFGKSGAELIPLLNDLADGAQRNTDLTNEQIAAADEYSKSQAHLKSELQQFLQVSAANAVPILVQVGDLFRSVASAQDGTSTASGLVSAAMSGVVSVFQTIAVVATDVVFVFKGVGREIGAIAAQLAALAHLDFSGFSAIGDAVRDDAVRARKELDGLQAKIMQVGQASKKFADPRILGNPGSIADQVAASRPKLDISGLSRDKVKKGGAGKKDNSAAQEAKAQLTADIDAIKKEQDALTNTISNNEKVMEAKRSASLIGESEYYAQKRKFLIENNAAQEAGAQKEIDRLSKEVLTGKDKIDNDRKIADAQAKLNKLRENGATNLEVLGIKEKDALDRITRGYVDARAAAQSYLDVTNRARQLELDSMGKGSKTRDYGAAISQITEKYEQQRQDLQRDNRNGKFAGRQDDYNRELALLNEFQAKSISSYSDYFKALDEKQKSFTLGASEGLKNYYDESQNVFKQTQDAVTNAFKGMEDAIVSFVTTGKVDFKSLVSSIIADLARIVIKQQITGPLANSLSGLLGGAASAAGGSGGGDVLGAFISGLGARAIGGPVSSNSMYRVNERGPELLNVAGKQYLMTGNQSGSVSPSGGGGGGNINYSPTFVLNEPASRKTQDQLAKVAGQGLRKAERIS